MALFIKIQLIRKLSEHTDEAYKETSCNTLLMPFFGLYQCAYYKYVHIFCPTYSQPSNDTFKRTDHFAHVTPGKKLDHAVNSEVYLQTPTLCNSNHSSLRWERTLEHVKSYWIKNDKRLYWAEKVHFCSLYSAQSTDRQVICFIRMLIKCLIHIYIIYRN